MLPIILSVTTPTLFPGMDVLRIARRNVVTIAQVAQRCSAMFVTLFVAILFVPDRKPVMMAT
jgi:hypothetical protein